MYADWLTTAGACSSKACHSFEKQRTQEESDDSEISVSSSEDSDGLEDIFFNVAVDSNVSQNETVEQDIIRNRCAALRTCMRDRPCLPVKDGGEPMIYGDVAAGVQLPMYTCPFLDCAYNSNDRATFLHLSLIHI